MLYGFVGRKHSTVRIKYNMTRVQGHENPCIFAASDIFLQDRNTARPQCCKIKLPDASVPTVIYHVYHHL